MEIDPASVFKDLITFTNDLKRGPNESLRLLQTLNRNLIEEQINSSYIGIESLIFFITINSNILFCRFIFDSFI